MELESKLNPFRVALYQPHQRTDDRPTVACREAHFMLQKHEEGRNFKTALGLLTY